MLSLLATTLLPVLALAQGQFGAPENSGEVLQALFVVDQTTVESGQGAQAYRINNTVATQNLKNENAALLQAWQNVTTVVQSSNGFYSDSGAQSLIDSVNDKVYPDTKYADSIYVQLRDRKSSRASRSGFIDYINPGLLKLRTAVDAASAAIQAKTPAKYLTQLADALLQIQQDYATTQEIQEFGYTK
ncbi:hypothetical protein EJ03DRAFT_276156 [Teratosphaeria nubilosa]|uniref:Uncharacterized protein n=1 Tax=Teratosphaeria nubilosa TaxID=161662 RepID=A0A6G1L3Q4_9PEZI|nr:hypothetical protein EJ03DRAFT_276156 [Teratosphaeria nubilosa]